MDLNAITADVVVIGGGANGTSAAFHLALMGVTNVILVERRQLAAGATGKSGALVRMHYTNPHESKLAYESLKVFREFGEYTSGGDAGWDSPGFVQVVAHGYEEKLKANVRAQREMGIDTRYVTPDELREIQPGLNVEDVGAAAYEGSSGFADPNATAYSFAAAAERLGARIWTHCEATRIVTEGDRVVRVETSNGPIATSSVVLAPGAYANALLAPLGLEYGLYPHRSMVAIFRWPVGWDDRHVVVIDNVNHTWLRPEGERGTLIGVEQPQADWDPDSFHEGVDAGFVELARSKLAARFPAFENATMRGGWSGIYMMSPDSRPIIDQVPSVQGLYVMLGDSGTSFKTAPAIGKCLAEWVIHGEPQTVDLTPFRSTRFAEGKPWVDDNAYSPKRQTISR
ncbi:MAG TPA: FAD-binding oxidoreductase [Thermomicrobiales bacterium]|nr:FAD-binding oxidoreductase [Thermomicrobiales bacterium]